MSDLAKSEQEVKLAFAAAMLKYPDDPFHAATTCIANIGEALKAANHWINDPIVVAEKMRLIESSDPKSFLPTKEEQAREIWKMANDKSIDEDNRLKAHALYAKIMGFIEAEKVAGPVNTINANNVMIVNNKGSIDEWEDGCTNQQRQLINHATQ